MQKPIDESLNTAGAWIINMFISYWKKCKIIFNCKNFSN